VVFDWGDRVPATGSLDDRIRRIVARWCKEIEGASSRHEVLLFKARALGGLCVGHNVSPAPYVPMLVAAAGDSGDATRTSGDGFAHGAQDPWRLQMARERVYRAVEHDAVLGERDPQQVDFYEARAQERPVRFDRHGRPMKLAFQQLQSEVL